MCFFLLCSLFFPLFLCFYPIQSFSNTIRSSVVFSFQSSDLISVFVSVHTFVLYWAFVFRFLDLLPKHRFPFSIGPLEEKKNIAPGHRKITLLNFDKRDKILPFHNCYCCSYRITMLLFLWSFWLTKKVSISW